MLFDIQTSCPNLAVPEQVVRHVVNIESSDNPFAIGVVGGRLERQPKNLEEAVATANMLESQGYNFSLGAAQINRYNLFKYGLYTYEKAFDLCSNLTVGAKILAECYTNAKGDWGKAFSCYYSGNFVTGFQTGYVQKIYDSMSQEQATMAAAYPVSSTIRVAGADPAATIPSQSVESLLKRVKRSTTPASRLSMRAVPFSEPARAAEPPLPAASTPSEPVAKSDVFVPQVRYPSGGNGQPAVVQAAPPAAPPAAPSKTSNRPNVDEAFVF